MPLLAKEFSCPRCRDKEDLENTCFSQSFSQYEGLIKRVIKHYKFQGDRTLHILFCDLFELMLEKYKQESYTLVPVPCSLSSYKRRGWDQMKVISDEMKRRGYPVFEAISRENRDIELKKMAKSERDETIDGLYYLDKKEVSRPSQSLLIIIDDVITTGTTLRYIRDMLYSVYGGQIIGMSIVMD